MHQHHTLEEIGHILENNAQGISLDVMLDRVIRFGEHLQREDHGDLAQHERNLDNLGKAAPCQ